MNNSAQDQEHPQGEMLTGLTYLQFKNLRRDLCKYFLNGNCKKGDKCTFSHVLKDFPCKFLTAFGHCDNGENCK